MPERDVITTGSAEAVMADSDASPGMALPAIGTLLGGKYRVERVLGQGGMGVVVEATHTGLAQRVAIKFLRNEAKALAGALDRFAREARACAQVKSDHVVRVFDTGVFETGEPYIVMELLDGEDLRSAIARRGALMPMEVATFAIEACEALAEAHALGIVHRDLKPANLFVVRRADGSAVLKVLDFGISKLQTSEAGMQTSANVTLGSPRYMSPEQIRTPRDVDARCDVWAMGVVMYEALAGHPPFEGEGMVGLATAIATERPSPLPQHVPFGLANVVMKCLEKDRRARFGSAIELAAALRPFAAVEAQLAADRIVRASGAPASTPMPASVQPISGYEPTVARSGTMLKRRSHRIEILASTAILVVAGGVALFVTSTRTMRRDSQVAPALSIAAVASSVVPVASSSPVPAEPIAPLEAIATTTTAPAIPARVHATTHAPPPATFATTAPAQPTPQTTSAPTARDPSGALRDRK
jgi:serine/threonine-protein kinase